MAGADRAVQLIAAQPEGAAFDWSVAADLNQKQQLGPPEPCACPSWRAVSLQAGTAVPAPSQHTVAFGHVLITAPAHPHSDTQTLHGSGAGSQQDGNPWLCSWWLGK